MKSRMQTLISSLVIGITAVGFLAALEPLMGGVEMLSILG